MIFKDSKTRDAHLSVPIASICEAVADDTPEGITEEQEKQLKSRKKTTRVRSEEDKWCNIYALLFPHEAIPSPCELFPLPKLSAF
jgi:hypothetical protein